MILGSGLLQASGWTPTWLIRDEFTDTVAAGSVDGTAATPGPGTRTVTDTGIKLSIGSGVVSFSGIVTNFADPALTYAAQTSSTGLAIFVNGTAVAAASAGVVVGFSGVGELYYRGSGVRYLRTGILHTDLGDLITMTGSPTKAAIILDQDQDRNIVVFMGASPKILWVDEVSNGGTLTPKLAIVGSADFGTTNYIRVVQLPAPFDSDDGLATDTHSGSVSSGTTFSHEADMLLEITVASLTTTNMSFSFRQASDTNRWFAYIVQNGDFYLFETVDGVSTQRAYAAGAIASGDRVVIVAEGSTIRGYSNNVLRWTYASATSHAAATTGNIMSVGNGGVFSDLKTWPRTLSGTAASILNKASA